MDGVCLPAFASSRRFSLMIDIFFLIVKGCKLMNSESDLDIFIMEQSMLCFRMASAISLKRLSDLILLSLMYSPWKYLIACFIGSGKSSGTL